MPARSAPEPSPVVAGVHISHAHRVVFAEPGITKLDLARYFERVGRWIVPHVTGRPLTLVRCPEGVGDNCLYVRHTKAWGPSALRRVKIREKTKIGEYLVADDVPALVALAQLGIVEIHTWNSLADDVERPNRMVWDLDPGPDVTWTDVVRAARRVRALLRRLGLESWVKTTGGRGLHVVAPIVPSRTWSECLAFSKTIAAALAEGDPQRYTIQFAKRGRENKILIDYLRNNLTNTSIAAFSPRARSGAPVSMPVSWAALGPRLNPRAFTVESVPRRLGRRAHDPWAGYWRCRQHLTQAAIRGVSLAMSDIGDSRGG